MSLSHSQFFINRELSWLEFNHRVLEEAKDKKNPLLERLVFLGIMSSNLDEFYEIRVSGLKQQKQSGYSEFGPDGMTPTEQLAAISKRVRRLVREQYNCWTKDVKPSLEAEGIRFLNYPDVSPSQKKFLKKYFEESVYPVLTPLAIDPGHPFPQLLNKSLNVVLELEHKDESMGTDLAIVQVPRILPRVVELPSKSGGMDFVFIGKLIQHHAASLFHGVKVKSAHQFRVTRNSNLYFDEEESDNLLSTIESELLRANRGNAVRLEVQKECPRSVSRRLQEIFTLGDEDLHVVDGPINFVRLMSLRGRIDRQDLKFITHKPVIVAPIQEDENIFDWIGEKDRFLHHPYESFKTVINFILQATEDPTVLAIKQTLYRTSGDSPIIPALIEAAQRGKEVTVIIELKARFDEAANIKWAKMLQEAGVNVVYGLVGFKTHCKAALVVRQEAGGIRRYAHIGTGNYNPSTARLYTDMGILTADQEVGIEVAELFNMLTGISRFPGMKNLLVAPHSLHSGMLALIRREAANATKGKSCGITAKMNSLVDEEVIDALYAASQAGVKVRLIVRGICCLCPGIKGVSDNIEVRSIVGRFLEHSRVFQFVNAGKPEVYIGSADWMPRNFLRRFEAVVKVKSEEIKARLFEVLEMQWKDNVKARALGPDGKYRRVRRTTKAYSVQEELITAAKGRRESSA